MQRISSRCALIELSPSVLSQRLNTSSASGLCLHESVKLKPHYPRLQGRRNHWVREPATPYQDSGREGGLYDQRESSSIGRCIVGAAIVQKLMGQQGHPQFVFAQWLHYVSSAGWGIAPDCVKQGFTQSIVTLSRRPLPKRVVKYLSELAKTSKGLHNYLEEQFYLFFLAEFS